MKKQVTLAKLDAGAKAKVEAINEQVKAGAITREEAQKQLADLGIKDHEGREEKDRFANLDADTKQRQQRLFLMKKHK